MGPSPATPTYPDRGAGLYPVRMSPIVVPTRRGGRQAPPPTESGQVRRPPSPSRPPLVAGTGWGRVYLTNRAGQGLRSADRNNKATLPRTRPSRAVQSYAKDSSPRMVKLQYAGWRPGLSPGPRCRPAEIQGRGLFVSDYDVREKDHRFLAWILT